MSLNDWMVLQIQKMMINHGTEGTPHVQKKNLWIIWICRETAYGPNVIYWSCQMGNDEGPLDFGYPQVWHTHSDLGKNERYFHQST